MRGEASGRGDCGLRLSWWAAGLHRPKAREENKIPFLFSFSSISKHFQLFLNPILNLNQTTQYKNSNATA
jgi:hypothetical protein